MATESGVECTLREPNLRIWGRAIQVLCSLGGSDIHFQFTEPALSLTTYDVAVSSFANLRFNKTFFGSYACQATEDDNLQCKVPVKCMLKPFRSTKFLTKCTFECRIKFISNADHLEVTFITKFGAKINYSVRLMTDDELIQLDCDINALKSIVTCDAKLILGSLSNFHQGKGTGDLTLKILGTHLSLCNSMTDLVKKEGKVYTELSLNSLDFVEYNVEHDCQLTVPLREFKTYAGFAEAMKLPVTLHFQTGTEPVMVRIASPDNTYEGTLTLANKGGEMPPPNSDITTTRQPSMAGPSSALQNSHRTNGDTTSAVLRNDVSTTKNPQTIVKKKRPLLFPNAAQPPKKLVPDVQVILLSDSDED